MSPTGPSQHVRAITSTLSARASPSVPPASQTYEPLARAVLRRRLLYHILPQSSLTVWASTTFWMTWHAGGISTLTLSKLLVIPIRPTTLFVTFLVWAFGVFPIIVLRKSHLTGEREAHLIGSRLTFCSCLRTLLFPLTACQSRLF
jgi:nucleoporin NDC1